MRDLQLERDIKELRDELFEVWRGWCDAPAYDVLQDGRRALRLAPDGFDVRAFLDQEIQRLASVGGPKTFRMIGWLATLSAAEPRDCIT